MSKHNGDYHASDIQPPAIQPEQLTAYALGQLHGEELASVKATVGVGRGSPDPFQRLTEGLGSQRGQETCAEQVREVQTLAAAITAARHAEPLPQPSGDLRAAIESRLDQLAAGESPQPAVELPAERLPWNRKWNRQWTIALVAAGGLCCLLVALLLPAVQASRKAAQVAQAGNHLKELPAAMRAEQALSTRQHESEYVGELRRDFSFSNDRVVTSSTPSDATVDDLAFMVKPRVTAVQDDSFSSGAGPQASPTTEPAAVSASISAGGAALNPGGAPYGESGGNQGQPATNNYAGGYGASISNGNPQAGGYPGGAFQAGGSSGPAASAGGGVAPFYKESRGSGGYPGSSQGYGGGYPGSASGSGDYGASIANNPVPETAAERSANWPNSKKSTKKLSPSPERTGIGTTAKSPSISPALTKRSSITTGTSAAVADRSPATGSS